MASLQPFPNCNPDLAARDIRIALKGNVKGVNLDKKLLLSVCSHLVSEQRQACLKIYNDHFQRSLVEDLKSALQGTLEDLLITMFHTNADAYYLRKAMKGMGTDERTVTEILIKSSDQELKQIASSYNVMYDRDLRSDIESETSGNLKTFYTMILDGERKKHFTGEPDEEKARLRATMLHMGGAEMFGANSKRLLEILMLTDQELRDVAKAFPKVGKHKTFEDMMKAEKTVMPAFKEALISIFKHAVDPDAYFAWRIYKSMKGLGTDDRSLIRLIVTHSEVDLATIRGAYDKEYKKTMVQWIKSDTSGAYCDVLLKLCGEDTFPPPGPYVSYEHPRYPLERSVRDVRIALKGNIKGVVGLDTDLLINAVLCLSRSERYELPSLYNRLYDRDLRADLKDALYMEFEKVMLALLNHQLAAKHLRGAMKGPGTDEVTITEILISRTDEELKVIAEDYRQLYNRDLKNDVRSETSGCLSTFYSKILNGERATTVEGTPDEKRYELYASMLHMGAAEMFGANSDRLLEVLMLTNDELKLVNSAFPKVGKDDSFKNMIKKKTFMDPSFKNALISIFMHAVCPEEFWAWRLYKSMKGLGTDDTSLIRILVCMYDSPLFPDIVAEYSKARGKTLAEAIEGETSGKYKQVLLHFVNRHGG
eukprot:m.100685 g.100685  ORF g.100685 m.100685 type:complete len:651 (+) comp22247_c0_seq1:306-2258(+)